MKGCVRPTHHLYKTVETNYNSLKYHKNKFHQHFFCGVKPFFLDVTIFFSSNEQRFFTLIPVIFCDIDFH